MESTRLMPLAGMDNRAEDAALVRGGQAPAVWVREALNVDISAAGRLSMRGQVRKVSDLPLRCLWRDPLRGQVFAVLGSHWVKVRTRDWSVAQLADLGGQWAYHCMVDGQVAVAGADGIWLYDGQEAQPLPMHTPGMPALSALEGALPPGDYGVAVSWLRGALESSVSEVAYWRLEAGGGLLVSLPACLDASVTGVRVYMTRAGSAQLQCVGDLPAGEARMEIAALPPLGGSPSFQYLDAMPSGRFLGYWRGRLLCAWARVLWFSEPMALHLHDRRHGFVQFAQRITFVAPVDAGVWVGQEDHVVFLAGVDPREFVMQRMAAQAPVPGSAVLLPAQLVDGDVSGGRESALWLAANGYVLGSAQGQLLELQSGHLQGIGAARGATAVMGDRVLTVLGPA